MKIKSLTLVVIAIVGLGLLLYFVNSQQATAQSIQLQTPWRQGYFSGQSGGNRNLTTGTVLTNGLMNDSFPTGGPNTTVTNVMNTANHAFTLTNKDQFISFIRNRRLSSNTRDRVGANFIIQVMRGVNSPSGQANHATNAEVDQWEALIRLNNVSLSLNPAVSESINSSFMDAITQWELRNISRPRFGVAPNYIPGSTTPPSGSDIRNCGSEPINLTSTGPNDIWSCERRISYSQIDDDMFFVMLTNLPALVISQNGVPAVRIKINCANIIGSVTPLRSQWNYSLNISNPGNRAPGDTFSINSRMENLSGVYPGDYPILTAADHGHRIWPSTNSAYVTWDSASTGGVENNSPAKSSLWQNFGPIVPGTGVTRTGTWRVNANTPNNTQICFTTHGSPRSGTPGVSVDWGPMSTSQCFMVYAPAANTWAYDINLNTNVAGTGSNYRTVSRGGLIALNSGVYSVGSIAGATYNQYIQPINATHASVVANNLTKESYTGTDTGGATSSTWASLAGLSPGTNRANLVNFRVRSTAVDGASFCFHAIVNPSAGPSPIIGNEHSSMLCYIVDVPAPPPPPTLTWNYDANVQSGTTSSRDVLPGASVTYVMNGVNSPATASGPSYTQRIVPTGDISALTNTATTTWIGASLAPGSSTPNRSVTKTVSSSATPGSRFCLNGNMSPSSGTSTGGVISISSGTPNWAGERCFTVIRNTYNYVPSTTVAPAVIYPGTEITVNGRITNTGSAGRGFDYTERIWANHGGSWLSPGVGGGDRTWTPEPGLSAGASRDRSTTYIVSNNVRHRELICFTTSVNPGTGYATPVTATNGGGTPEDEYCIRVYNERFAMTSAISKGDAYVSPGGTARFQVFVSNRSEPLEPSNNNGDITARNNFPGVYPNAVRGNASGITCVFSASGSGSDGINGSPSCSDSTPGPDADAFNGTVEVRVDPNSSPGEEVCLQVSGVFLNGFSDGEDRLGRYITPPTCYVVGVTPYFHAYNGDVWAGGIFDTLPRQPIANCDSNPPAPLSIIKSVRSNLTNLWRGSFVEYAAFATGDISGFASYGIENIPGLFDRRALTFANDDWPTSLGKYTSDTKCIPNYFELLYNYSSSTTNATAGTINPGLFPANTQTSVTGDFRLNGPNSNLTGKRTIVINGNLTITGNITLNSTNYGNSTSLNIPSLVFVVSGNIFIDQSVERIDALLISQGDEGVWTCSDNAGSIRAVAQNTCSRPLTINGAIITNRLNLMRTHEQAGQRTGGVHDPNSSPAEIINFLPEFYLSEPIFESDLLSEDSFMTVLVKDLPPIY